MQDFSAIDVGNSINSGQVFLWKKRKDCWYGTNGQDVLRINNSGRIKSYQNNKTDFFRKKDDIGEILESISKDKTTKKAVTRYLGLRLLEQDPFQCLVSFIVSSNSSIQKIKTCLENFSKKFGKRIKFDGQELFLFPEPKVVANASIADVLECGIGYRSRFVIEAARRVVSKEIDLEKLKRCSYSETKRSICSVPGVGNKVADCIMLFSLNKLEAFPLDRWMIRILEKYHNKEFELATKTITDKQYGILHEKIVEHFGPYAGYAQQFLFKMERENYQRGWL